MAMRVLLLWWAWFVTSSGQSQAASEDWDLVKQKGAVVALHASQTNRFLRMTGGSGIGSTQGDADLPNLPNMEGMRFVVVEGPSGTIGLYNAHFQKYMQMYESLVEAVDGSQVDTLPDGWVYQRFSVRSLGNSQFGLYSDRWQRWVRITDTGVVDGSASASGHENFTVVDFASIPSTTTTTTTARTTISMTQTATTTVSVSMTQTATATVSMTQTATTTVSVSMNQTATTTASMTQTTTAEANQSKTEISGTSQAAAVTSTISQTRTRTISSTTSHTQTSTQPRAAAAEPMANTEVTEVPWLALLCFLAGFAVLVAVLGFLWRRWRKKPGREVLDVREPGDQDTQTDLEVEQKSLFESVAPGAAPPQSSNGSGTGCQVAGETSMQVLEVKPGDQDAEKILLGSAAPPEDQTQDAKSQEQASMHTALGVEPDDQDIDLEVSGSAVLHDPRQDSREVLEADQFEPQLRDSVSSSWWCWCGVEAPEPIVPDSSLKLARDTERSLSEAVLSVEKRTRTLSSTSSLQAPCREEEAPRIAMISARFNDKNKKTEMKFREVCDTLRQRQLEVLMVEAGGGEDFGTLTAMYLGKLKKKKGIMLAVCTPDYGERTSSPYCTYAELKFAMDHGIDILPLKVDSVYPPSPPCEDGVASGLVQMAMPDNKVYIDCVGKSVDDIAAKIEEKLRSSKARGRSGHG